MSWAREASAALVLVAMASGCGAESGSSGGPGGVGGASGVAGISGAAGVGGGAGTAASGGTAGAAGGAAGAGSGPCETPEGIRLCGGECDWLDAEDCPAGCSAVYDRAAAGDSPFGLCFADLTDLGNRPCFACRDGEVCVQRARDVAVCVPESVCAGLWALGARDVCRYADYASYDGRPVPEPPASCPAEPDGQQDPGQMCGGACGACLLADEYPCTGRSPEHPQGFCRSYEGSCRAAAGDNDCADTWLCAVFRVPTPDAPTARASGHCFGRDTCLELAVTLPGGVDCYDAAGNVVPPG